MTDLLEVSDVSRRFGGLNALDGVSFRMPRNEIRGLIGPNGAGKSTLMNIICGHDRGATGSIHFNGDQIRGRRIHQIASLGIARVFQNPRVFPGLTVLQNVMVGCHTWSRSGFVRAITGLPAGRREEREITAFAESLLEDLGLSPYALELPQNLAYGHQRMVEIARALASRPKLLLLDEPAAGLNPAETDRLKQLLLGLNASGLALLLVEHNMDLVMSLCETLTVLSFGRVIADGSPAEIRGNSDVIDVYLGSAPVVAA
ncbi:ABC-type branched-subunit amino acid transport system ATPase component [Rhodoligotrophos appendicifer]|uniref:ABC transporter ATP-binding protein n=1 Tax=Rhodoligotrophos appendicifer TaxID=987056 RepID=UPI001184CD4B|nr:ABC transporter ATP-binding protein [Rhodoligotrophos appendicifer]